MTLEPTVCSVLNREEVRQAITTNPDIAIQMISTLIGRARVATASVRNLALLDVYGRVARLLLDMAEDKDGKLVIPERLTQQDIGDRVGASRDMVSRIFKDLVAGGYIRIEHKIITILRKPPERW
jgi:CRP/FNR family cyclic AMP-dependent transcriptional regulator